MTISLSAFCKENDLPKSSVYRKAQDMGIDTAQGLTHDDCNRLLEAFDKPPILTVEVESGNHSITLATPELPQTYSLEGLRQSEAVGFEDPLAVAQQFLAIADQVQSAMEQDIQQREQRLQQTKQAKSAIESKAQELRLEQRFYQERTRNLDSNLSSETQDLQSALSALQSLGKPTDGASTGQS